MLTKLFPEPRNGVNPASAKLMLEGGGSWEGKGSTSPAVPKGSERIAAAGSVGSGGTLVGPKLKSVPPGQGASSVDQSDIHPFSVSKKSPPPPRILVLPLPKGSQAIPMRGEKFVWSG